MVRFREGVSVSESVVQGITDLGGAVLRTLYVLRPITARFGWCHGAVLSNGFTGERARTHHNYWAIEAGIGEPEDGHLAGAVAAYAVYPSMLFACEKYLIRLESLYPAAYLATGIEAFARGLVGWPGYGAFTARLVALDNQQWPPHPPTYVERG